MADHEDHEDVKEPHKFHKHGKNISNSFFGMIENSLRSID